MPASTRKKQRREKSRTLQKPSKGYTPHMSLSIEVPQIKCLRCGLEAQTQPQALANDGKGGWKPVNVMRPAGWVQGPAAASEVEKGLCTPCGDAWKKANTEFLVMPEAEPSEEPKCRVSRAKGVATIPTIAVRNPIDTNIPYTTEKIEAPQPGIPQFMPPASNVSALKNAPYVAPSHIVSGRQIVAPVPSVSSPLKVSIGEILNRNVATVTRCVPQVIPVPLELQTREAKAPAPSNVTHHAVVAPPDTHKKMQHLTQAAVASTLHHVAAPPSNNHQHVVHATSGTKPGPIPQGVGPAPIYTKGRAGI